MAAERRELTGLQREMRDWVLEHPRAALFAPIGCGKTAAVLMACAALARCGAIRRAVVLAPMWVAKTVWTAEAGEWSELDGYNVKACAGESLAKRIEILESKWDMLVCNNENAVWLSTCLRLGRGDLLAVDESTAYKSWQTRRFKAARRMSKDAGRAVVMSGTPAPEGLLGLWAQYAVLDQGESLGTSIVRYREQHFVALDYNRWRWRPKASAMKNVMAAVEPVTLAASAESPREPPAKIVERIQLPPEAARAYKAMERDLVAILEDGSEIDAESAGICVGKLQQICNGFAYTPDGWASPIHDRKTARLQEIREDNPGEGILVMYQFREDLEEILKAFKDAREVSSDAIERWNARDLRMLVAHPQSAAHGLNLQYGGSLMVWHGLTWSLERYVQACGRLDRRGQEERVRIVHIVAEGRIDETILDALSGKRQTQDEIFQALRQQHLRRPRSAAAERCEDQ